MPLHQFIIRTVEMDQMMFIRAAAPRSYLFSVALTLFFTVVVCRLMRRHIKKISMVESMKDRNNSLIHKQGARRAVVFHCPGGALFF